jgi:hypothetical protein
MSDERQRQRIDDAATKAVVAIQAEQQAEDGAAVETMVKTLFAVREQAIDASAECQQAQQQLDAARRRLATVLKESTDNRALTAEVNGMLDIVSGYFTTRENTALIAYAVHVVNATKTVVGVIKDEARQRAVPAVFQATKEIGAQYGPSAVLKMLGLPMPKAKAAPIAPTGPQRLKDADGRDIVRVTTVTELPWLDGMDLRVDDQAEAITRKESPPPAVINVAEGAVQLKLPETARDGDDWLDQLEPGALYRFDANRAALVEVDE